MTLAPRLPTQAIPQADSPSLLLKLLNFVAAGEHPTPELLGVHERQVLYYRTHESYSESTNVRSSTSALTKRGEFLLLRPTEERLAALAVVFEESELGKALLLHCGAQSVREVDIDCIDSFLREKSMLSGTTIGGELSDRDVYPQIS